MDSPALCAAALPGTPRRPARCTTAAACRRPAARRSRRRRRAAPPEAPGPTPLRRSGRRSSRRQRRQDRFRDQDLRPAQLQEDTPRLPLPPRAAGRRSCSAPPATLIPLPWRPQRQQPEAAAAAPRSLQLRAGHAARSCARALGTWGVLDCSRTAQGAAIAATPLAPRRGRPPWPPATAASAARPGPRCGGSWRAGAGLGARRGSEGSSPGAGAAGSASAPGPSAPLRSCCCTRSASPAAAAPARPPAARPAGCPRGTATAAQSRSARPQAASGGGCHWPGPPPALDSLLAGAAHLQSSRSGAGP
mmetsp:Transcript_56363/g.164775  ORF Transcript_56363/g.164775 Transcript_56363/m.164775 type:complete len:305 (+) Transcript_56363:609-1523(+)